MPSAVLKFLERELRKAELSCSWGKMWPACYIVLEIHTWGKISGFKTKEKQKVMDAKRYCAEGLHTLMYITNDPRYCSHKR